MKINNVVIFNSINNVLWNNKTENIMIRVEANRYLNLCELCFCSGPFYSATLLVFDFP